MSDIYKSEPDVMQTDLGDELVLVHARTGHSYRLNATARLGWLHLPGTAQALADTLTEKFEVDRETAIKDAAAVLESLVAQGLALKVP
jgi:Coenzyme PQQ synthesis protein D (PqqD)